MKNMKFGMPTLVECADIYSCCDEAIGRGLDFVEINMSFPQYLPSRLDVEALKKIMRDKGIFFTIHADEMLNPFDFNPKVAECYLEVMRDTLRFAKELQVPVINMHLLKGVYVTLPERVVLLTDVYIDGYLNRVRSFISMCESELEGSKVRIAIENVDSNLFTSSQIKALELFMKSPVFGLTLDTGHELCLNFGDREIFKKYPEGLIHMHLHDAKGRSAHLPLGTAEVKVEEKLALLKEDGTCLIEVKTLRGLDESIDYLNKKGYI